MPIYKKRTNFFESEEGKAVREQLMQMLPGKTHNTVASYTPDGDNYPDNSISFVDKHMRYLNTNPQVDPAIYLANLRLKTRVKTR